jgi:hypothetical protein
MVLFPSIFIIFWLVSMALFGGAVWLGYAMHAPGHGHWLLLHMLGGLLAAFVNVLLQTAVMMHLVGTGRSIKLAMPHVRSGRDYRAEQLPLKNRSYPIAVLACVAAVATAILGGARNFGAVPGAVHEAFAWATIAVNAIALPWHYALLRKNGAVVLALERELEGIVADMEEKGELPEGLMPWQK